jgi:hypothetical protein
VALLAVKDAALAEKLQAYRKSQEQAIVETKLP